jgi:hypothetical protein
MGRLGSNYLFRSVRYAFPLETLRERDNTPYDLKSLERSSKINFQLSTFNFQLSTTPHFLSS